MNYKFYNRQRFKLISVDSGDPGHHLVLWRSYTILMLLLTLNKASSLIQTTPLFIKYAVCESFGKLTQSHPNIVRARTC